MAPTMKLQDQLGTDLFDLSSYMRLTDDAGFDPSRPFEEGAFQETSLAEGAPLLNVDVRNREFTAPVWVKAADKPTMTALVSQLNRLAQQTRRLYFKDDGDTLESYFDVTWVKVEPTYVYNRARKAYLACTVTVYCTPPYAHTGTARIVATGQVATVPLEVSLASAAIAGDVSGQMQVTVKPGAAGPDALGRAMIFGGVPTGWTSFIPAASFFQIFPGATRIGASGAPGSQAVVSATVSVSSVQQLFRFALSASPYAGRNRVFAIARPGSAQGLALYARDELNQQLGPTALAPGLSGWQFVDLGVANVGSHAATHTFGIGGGPPVTQLDDASLRLQDGSLGGVAGLFILPEDNVRVVNDPAQRIAGRTFAASGQSTQAVVTTSDDYGNPFAPNPGVFASFCASALITPTGITQGGNASTYGGALTRLPQPLQDFRIRSRWYLWNGATGQPAMYAVAGDDFLSPYLYAMLSFQGFGIGYPVGSGPVLAVGYDTGTWNQYGIGLPVPSQALLFAPSAQIILDLVRRYDQMHVNMRVANATQFMINLGNATQMVSVACVAIPSASSDALLRQGVLTPLPDNALIYSRGSQSLTHFEIDTTIGLAFPSDNYTLSEIGESYRQPRQTTKIRTVPLSDQLRGGPLTLAPDTAEFALAVAHRDGGPMNEAMDVELRLRERFRYLRG